MSGTKEAYALTDDFYRAFADYIVLFSKSTTEAETMLKKIKEVGKRFGLQINRKKTQFIENAYGEGEGI